MALLDRYLAREILPPFAAGVLFLTQLFLATQIVGQARILFGSGVSLRDVAVVVVCLVPNVLAYVIPIAFLLGAIVGVGRLAGDREVVALSAAGISPARLVRVPLALSLIVAAAGLWLALEVEPMGLRTARLTMNDIVMRSITLGVRGGTFYDQIPGYTLYVAEARDGQWENVLVHDMSDPAAAVLAVAKRGRLEPAGQREDMRLVLEAGELHREQADADEYVVAEFARGELVLGVGTTVTESNRVISPREQTLAGYADRIADARRRGDAVDARRWEGNLQRKIASVLVVIPFALLAVPLGAWRRGGRAFGVAATCLIVVVDYVLMRGGQVLVQRGSLPAVLGLELGNIVLVTAALGLIAVLDRRGPGAVR